MNDDDKKKLIEEEGVDANPDNGDLDALEPAEGAEENEGADVETIPEDTGGVAEENEFSSGGQAAEDRN